MKIDRLVGMIMVLLEKERVGAGELAAMFEVSPRTIYRDIDTIAMAGIPVRATPGVGGGFEIMPEYKLDKKVFSDGDLSALLMGLTSLSGMVRGEELVNALAKVKSFIPADRAQAIEGKASQVHIDLSPWTGSRNTGPYLEIIQTALQESRLLAFEYADRHGNRTRRTAEPHQLVLKSRQWYWQGYCRTREDFRLFKLNRTAGLRMLDEGFVPREIPQPQLDSSDIVAALQTRIRLRIHRSIADRVLEYCDYEDLSPDGAEHYTVCFPFIENEYYYTILLSFGDRCECLEPPAVREGIRRRALDIAEVYGE